ncbi:MAG: hypothetical protein ACTHOO_09680 [Alcanivorax sp.]
MIKLSRLLFLFTVLIAPQAFAQAQDIEPAFVPEDFEFSYSPEYCDFTAAFPEQPMETHHCETPDDPSTCFNLLTYTHTFGLSSSVRIELVCNPVTPEMYDHFTAENMQATVRAMTKDSVVEELNVTNRDTDHFRQTTLVASGRQGLDETIYIAQLWIAQNSIMSVEAEMMGEQTTEADHLFANILRNIGHLIDIKGEEYAKKKISAWEAKKDTALQDIQKQQQKDAENAPKN